MEKGVNSGKNLHFVCDSWDGHCIYCGSTDIAMQARTKYNEHWECGECGGRWYLNIEESVRASKAAGVRCCVDELVADMCTIPIEQVIKELNENK